MSGSEDEIPSGGQEGPAAAWPRGSGEMAARVRALDWAATPLGPIQAWPASLRTSVDLVLASPLGMIVLWGPELVQIYNDGYRAVMGAKHPAGLGQPTRDCWPEVWAFNAPIYDVVRAGEARLFADQKLVIERHGLPEDTWWDLTYSPLRDERGEVGGVLVTVIETTAKVRSEALLRERTDAALREGEARYQALFTAIDEGFYLAEAIFDAAGRCTDISFLDENPAAREMIGQSAKGRRMSDLGSYEQDWRDIFGRVATTGEARRMERFAQPSGVWYDFYVFKPPHAGPNAFAVIFRDVTARKRADEALRVSEERHRLIVESVRDYAIFTTDAEGLIATWPPGAESVFGWHADEALGQPVDMTFVPEDRATGQPQKERADARETGSAPNIRWHQRKDGSRVFIEGRAMAMHGADGEVSGFLKIGQDVTERERERAALRQSEERFRSFAENSADTLWIADARTGQLEYLSPAFEMMWGETRERVMSDISRWRELVHPDDRERAAAGMPKLVRGETVQQTYRIVRPRDGAVRFIQDTGFPIRDEEGRVRRTAGISQDVTEQRNLGAARAESERRLRVLMEGIPQLVWRAGEAGQWTWASAQWIEFTGQRQEESHGRGWLDVIHPDDRARALEAWDAARASGMLDVEYRILRCEDGAWIWHRSRSLPVRDAAGHVLEWLGTSTDIEDIKRAEARLAESEERFRLIVENARDYAIFLSDADDRVSDWLPSAARVFGWSADEITGQPAAVTFTSEDRAAGVPEREIRTARREGSAPDIRWHLRRDGSRVFIDGRTIALRDPDGSPRGFLKIGQDRTAEREAQDALGRSEALFRTLATGVEQLVFLSASDGARNWGSPQWERFTGLSFEQSLGLGWLEAVHPEDREATLQAWRDAMRSGAYHAEHRIRWSEDGNWRWHQTRARPIDPDHPQASEWVGASTDFHDLRDLREAQAVLVAELQHRTRNLVAVVRSVAERTLAGSASLEDFGARFDKRMEALGRVQGMLSRLGEGQRVSFDTLIRAELDAHGALDGERSKVTLTGPANIRLRSAHVQTLALALHELATNALKHGALNAPGGRLFVGWQVTRSGKGRELAVEWRESGVDLPLADAPARKGYGRELIERALPYQLKAETRYELGPDGVRCLIRMPLDA